MRYEVTWEKFDKYNPFTRKTTVTADNEEDARGIIHTVFGNENKIKILEIKEMRDG